VSTHDFMPCRAVRLLAVSPTLLARADEVIE
jgi:hypothetical protein